MIQRFVIDKQKDKRALVQKKVSKYKINIEVVNRNKLRNLSRLIRIFILKIAKKFKKSLIEILELSYENGSRYTIIIENLLEKI